MLISIFAVLMVTKVRITQVIFIFSLLVFSREAEGQAKVVFESKTVDFGTVVEGTLCKHRFAYKNIGSEPFTISNVSVTCGCTVPQWSKEPLKPGDTASLYIQFDTRNKMGEVAKGVNLSTNSEEPMIGLIILAKIIADSNFKIQVDSISQHPMRIVNYKSSFEISLPFVEIQKLGYTGNLEGAMAILKRMFYEKNLLLYNSVGVSQKAGHLTIGGIDKSLIPMITSLLKAEILDTTQLKLWVQKTE